MGTCVLSLRSPSRAYLIPYTPYIMLALQLGASFVALGGLRLRLGKTYKPMMMILSLLVFLTIWSLGLLLGVCTRSWLFSGLYWFLFRYCWFFCLLGQTQIQGRRLCSLVGAWCCSYLCYRL